MFQPLSTWLCVIITAQDHLRGTEGNRLPWLTLSHLADLNLRLDISVVWHVADDLRPMRSHGLLEFFHRIEVQSADTGVGCRRPWRSTRQASVDLVADHSVALASVHDQGHVFFGIVVVIELLAGSGRVENGDADHIFEDSSDLKPANHSPPFRE